MPVAQPPRHPDMTQIYIFYRDMLKTMWIKRKYVTFTIFEIGFECGATRNALIEVLLKTLKETVENIISQPLIM